jgi:hypothetical protein
MTLLPLDSWRDVISYTPWHFWGISSPTHFPITSSCNTLVYKYGWQGTDQAGREDIKSAIENAEKIVFDNMDYWPAPKYRVDTLPWPRYNDNRLSRLTRRDSHGNWIPVQLREGYIQNVGVETFELLENSAAVSYTDHDGDGVKEDFTVSFFSSVDPSEIIMCFTDGDQIGGTEEIAGEYQIQPVNVLASGGGAITIYGKRWLCVKPHLYEEKENYPIDPTDDTKFITTCDVYRRYVKRDGLVSTIDSQAALIWESHPCGWCDSTNNSSDPSSEGWVTARAGIRDSINGIVTPAEAVYNAIAGTWSHPGECFTACSEPDKVLVRYLAGMDLDNKYHMQKQMKIIVARLAAAEMTRRICACDNANREWSNWQFDVSRVNAPEAYQINLDVLSNPIGTRRGHIYAWQQFKSLARIIGTLA